MARDHKPEKEQAPQVVEREINLGLLNAKLNEAINLLYQIVDKVGLDLEEEN